MLLSLPASAEAKELEFGYVNLPPFGYTDDEGRSKGYLVALARRVFEGMDQPVRFVQHPATRLYRQMESGETAFTLGAAGLHRLTDTAVESQEPAAKLTIALYRQKSTESISNVNELKDKRVILIKGYTYGQLGRFFEEHRDAMQIIEANGHKSALRMIQFDRADYLLNYQTPAETTIAHHQLNGLDRDIIGQLGVHFFVSRALENAQSLADAWDKQLRALKRNGQLPEADYDGMAQ
ncbi:transporter substrate-binding domain-containing protein [Salicola sp. Rm-C-2C1-2]|uniref:substrate-binding periplasmic protein n=1 Tax=Salicola sp. Rm-C-2C1-2 TaxID=3141321 RepID=UPI0032E39321